MIPLDWRASCRRPSGFTSTYQPTTHPKLLTSLSHPPPVLQYQNPCKWIPPSFLVRNARADCQLDSACTVQLPITTWGPAPSDQRWVLFSQNLSFPHFPCSQYNYSLQSIPLQPPPLSTRAPLATSSRRICWVAYICLTTVMPRSSESKRSKENRMDVAMWGMSPLLWSWRSVACIKRRSHSWYCSDPLWTSSWDTPVSFSIYQMGLKWGDSLERTMPSTLPHRTSKSTPQVTCHPDRFHTDWEPWAQSHSLYPIWLCGIPGCLQQAGSHPTTTSPAMWLCHQLAAWKWTL